MHLLLIILRKNQVKIIIKKYIFIYLYTSKSWSSVFIVAMFLLSKINSNIIHPFSTYSLSFFFFFSFILISQIIVILSPTFFLPFTFSSSYYYLPYYPFGYCICVPRLAFHLFFFFKNSVNWVPMGPVHCSRDPQTYFFKKTSITKGAPQNYSLI